MIAPKVTVLMPVYNGEKYLREAIDSILSQIFTDFEFLIINDGSTDGSVGIIKSYDDPRIRLINNDKNIGVVKTLNKGIELAGGQYLARMDCDDVSLPKRLEKQVSFLDANPDIDLCGTWVNYFGGKNITLWKTVEEDEVIRSYLIFNPSVAHPTVIFRLKILRKDIITYGEQFVHAEDYGLWVSMFHKAKFANLQEILYHHRKHPNSVSNLHWQQQEKTANHIRSELLKKLKVSFSKKELQIHQNISNQHFTCTRNFVLETSDWLSKLHQSNIKNTFFPESAFSKVLAERWYRVCRKAQKLGPWTWNTFWSSPLSSFINLPLKNRIGFASKCILRVR